MANVRPRREGPRDALERAVRSIWADVLGHRDFGVHESFFACGGTSFAMLRVQASLAASFGYEIPFDALLAAPSVAGTAVLLRGAAGKTPAALVALAPNGALAPVFCFHPLGGSVAVYWPLAVSLPDHPVYGLQALGLAAGHPAQPSLDEMVCTYVDAILDRYPDGPHQLVGYSLGGVIAFSAAHRLRRLTGQAPLVILLGTSVRTELDEREPYRAVGAYALQMDLDYDAIAATGRRTAIATIYDEARRRGVFGAEFPIERLQRIFDTAFANLHAVSECTLQPYDGEVVLVHAQDDPNADAWSRYATRLTRYSVSLPHAMLLEERSVRRIAPLLVPHLAGSGE